MWPSLMKVEIVMKRKDNEEDSKEKSYQLKANYVYLTTYQ